MEPTIFSNEPNTSYGEIRAAKRRIVKLLAFFVGFLLLAALYTAFYAANANASGPRECDIAGTCDPYEPVEDCEAHPPACYDDDIPRREPVQERVQAPVQDGRYGTPVQYEAASVRYSDTVSETKTVKPKKKPSPKPTATPTVSPSPEPAKVAGALSTRTQIIMAIVFLSIVGYGFYRARKEL